MSEQQLGDALKKGMRNLASGVCVISCIDENGKRFAMTASSLTSVSAEPPSLLVCVNKNAALEAVLSKASKFSVSVLNSNQEEVSNTCATPAESENRFNVGNWATDEASGLSYLSDALSIFFCEKKQTVPYGTHSIYIGDITSVEFGDGSAGVLVYARGAYHSI
ncbi:MAG: flavin reductase family protein [Agarilytica sp.]